MSSWHGTNLRFTTTGTTARSPQANILRAGVYKSQVMYINEFRFSFSHVLNSWY
jgi:hypothetical protein